MMKRRPLLWVFPGFLVFGILLVWVWFSAPLTIHVRIAENGGFTPSVVKTRVGERLRLRLVSEDVGNSFALGQNSMKPVLLKPGEPVEIRLTFDKPGTYTFYTTTPSSVNFWRMRGTIEVSGDAPIPTAEPPLYVRLGLNLDDEHQPENSESDVRWSRQPSALRGATFNNLIPTSYLEHDFYLAQSPQVTFEKLKADSTFRSLSDDDLWDIVAFIWQKNTSPDNLLEGKKTYQVNCAACHGETGAGDGQFAAEMKATAQKSQDEHGIQPPTDFSNPEHLLEASPAILQGKTLRGGMGTGMPMWGTIFTDQQTWNLVAYMYTFQFDYSR